MRLARKYGNNTAFNLKACTLKATFKLILSSSDPLEASIQILRVCVFVCLCIMEGK